MSNAAAAVFDLDGTLICLPIDWEALFAEFGRIMRVDTVRPLVDTISQLDLKTRNEVFLAWDKTELAVFHNATPCGQGMHLYREFADKPKALVTLQGKAVVQQILKKFSLTFTFVITREDSLSRAVQLQTAIEKLGASPKDVLFVGNAESDQAAAKKVGCNFQKV